MLPDPLEIAEAKAEAWAEDNIRPRSLEFRCPDCGKWVSLTEACPCSSNPYSIPICRSCAKEE
jgi:predicted RNA-binding Zn-ribbon protein involved in translation (DUF1610 family)